MADDKRPAQDGMERLRVRLLDDPRLSVAADLPLAEKNTLEADSFDLGYRLGPVYDIVRNRATDTPLAIAIRGEWGVGKTSAMRWLEARLLEWNEHLDERPDALEKAVRVLPVWFYPWKYQDREDVWKGLVAEVIIACLKRKQTELGNRAVQEQIKKLSFLGSGVRRLLTATKLQIGGGPLKVTLDGAKLLKSNPSKDDEPEAAFLNTYEKALKDWVKGALGNDDRLVILIDDLDRCLPEVALQVLEALKLYLDSEKIIFVLGIDRTVVDQIVRKHYGDLGVDAVKSAEYLDKMFQVEVVLAPSYQETGNFFDAIVADNSSWAALAQEADAAGNPQDIFRRVILNIARRSPREIKRLVNTTLMAGEGVEMSSRSWGGHAEIPTLVQGGQAALLQRILRERYSQHERLIGDPVGNTFFAHWSARVRSQEDLKADRTPVHEISETALLKLEGNGSEGDRSFALKHLLEGKDENLKSFLDGEQFVPFLRLLTDPQLADLMRIDFSSEAARAVADDIRDSDWEMLENAIIRALVEKGIDNPTREDWPVVTELGSGPINFLA